MQSAESTQNAGTADSAVETKSAETTAVNNEKVEEPKTASKPKRARRTKKVVTKES